MEYFQLYYAEAYQIKTFSDIQNAHKKRLKLFENESAKSAMIWHFGFESPHPSYIINMIERCTS